MLLGIHHARSNFLVGIYFLYAISSAERVLRAPAKTSGGRSKAAAVPWTTRVSPINYDETKCISSATIPILTSTVVTCPCFLRYIISSDMETTWDVFLIPKESYDLWKGDQYQGDPPDVVEEYSTRKWKTTGGNSFLRSEDRNVFIDGDFQLAVRTNSDEERCFNDPTRSGIQTSVVFESMPATCEIMAEEPDPRVVGGTAVTKENSEDEFKWMALIWQNGVRPVCGGAQIAPGYVVTAAHCLVQLNVGAYHVRLGTLQAEKGEEFKILRAFTHPQYHQLETNEALNDITILELDKDGEMSIEWNEREEVPKDGEIVTTAGFGFISENWGALPSPNRLLRVDIPVVGSRECEEKYENVQGGIHICAGYEDGGCDSCQSDSGGPLRYVETGGDGVKRAVLVGIVSFGSGCARPGNPGVYTRVSAFRDWINETLVEAKESRVRNVFLRNPVAIVGVGAGVLVLVVVVVVGMVYLLRARGRSGRGQVADEERSSVPSTSGIS